SLFAFLGDQAHVPEVGKPAHLLKGDFRVMGDERSPKEHQNGFGVVLQVESCPTFGGENVSPRGFLESQDTCHAEVKAVSLLAKCDGYGFADFVIQHFFWSGHNSRHRTSLGKIWVTRVP